jgi:two-component system, OmpR family, response regulator MprA
LRAATVSCVNTPGVLIVDDDPAVLSAVVRGLRIEGYRPWPAEDGAAALSQAQIEPPNVAILDLMLPDMDGLDLCRQMRKLGTFAILMLTARDGVRDRVDGLDSGADDYLVKPFAMAELLARLRALLRRAPSASEEKLAFADLTLDLGTREVFRGERRVDLRPRELELLELFLRYPRRVLRRGMIFERVWGFELIGESNVIDVTIKNLRRRLEEAGEPRLIQTAHRAGYALREET